MRDLSSHIVKYVSRIRSKKDQRVFVFTGNIISLIEREGASPPTKTPCVWLCVNIIDRINPVYEKLSALGAHRHATDVGLFGKANSPNRV